MKIHHEVAITASPDRVYELLTNGAKFGDVLGKAGKGGGSTGTFFSLFDGWLRGRQIELVANEMVVQAWRMKDWEPGVYSIVRFELKPEGAGTRLLMDQDGIPEAAHDDVTTTWANLYFAPMTKHFGA